MAFIEFLREQQINEAMTVEQKDSLKKLKVILKKENLNMVDNKESYPGSNRTIHSNNIGKSKPFKYRISGFVDVKYGNDINNIKYTDVFQKVDIHNFIKNFKELNITDYEIVETTYHLSEFDYDEDYWTTGENKRVYSNILFNI